jgi:predicted dehydrogenase
MKYQRELTFAIVGCGLIGRRRMGTLSPGSLKYACDLDQERAKQLAAATTNCASTADLEAVLGDSEIDAIIVAVANAALAPLHSGP